MRALENRPKPAAPPAPLTTAESGAATEGDRVIVCAACTSPITQARHRIAVSGAHEHRFMNPAGYLFHIGCFALAIGCTVAGPSSSEYTWFPGTVWRYARCGACGQHLGWHFRAKPGDGFFGLILDRLRERTSLDA
jgi:hypothetical protein